MNRILYFAFGSNLSSERIRFLNKSAVFKAVALLRGYRLEFCFRSQRWGGSAANIIPDQKSDVYGVLWELEKYDLENLDIQEGVSLQVYRRIPIEAEVDGTLIPCFAYQLTEKTRNQSVLEDGENQKPSKIYKTVIVRGAKEHQLPQEYIQFLDNLEDNGFEGPVNLGIPD